jgi:hypothetical protein
VLSLTARGLTADEAAAHSNDAHGASDEHVVVRGSREPVPLARSTTWSVRASSIAVAASPPVYAPEESANDFVEFAGSSIIG